MVTIEVTCAAICSPRGVRSTTRKLATQAAMLAAIRKAIRRKVRQNKPLRNPASRTGVPRPEGRFIRAARPE